MRSAPKYGRGLSPLPIRDATYCIHGTAVAAECKRCNSELYPRRRKAKVSA